jgi:hypothetical protein
MGVTDLRRFSCDSCTRIVDIKTSSASRDVPAGWIQATVSNQSRANHPRWWCEQCVGKISDILPNALGELDPHWPNVGRRREPSYCGLGPCCLEGGHAGPCKQ